MSEETTETKPVANEKNELELEKKVELHKMESKSDQDEALELEKIRRNKDEILNEKKRIQQEKRQLQDELNAMKAALEQQQREKLEEKQEYKQLWERTQEELKAEREKLFNVQNSIVRAEKRKAFDRELGKPLSKDRYYDFVNFDDIIIEEDGTVNSDSVRYAVNLFRESYRELVPQQSTPRVGSEAPSNDGVIRPKKTLNDMNKGDRSSMKRRLLQG